MSVTSSSSALSGGGASTSMPLGFGFPPAPLYRTQSSGNIRLSYPRLGMCEVVYIQAPKPPAPVQSPHSTSNSTNAAALLQAFAALSASKYEEDTLKRIHAKQSELAGSKQSLQELILQRRLRIEHEAEEKVRKQKEEDEAKRQKEREEELKRRAKEEADRRAAELKRSEEDNLVDQFMELSGIVDGKLVREYLNKLEWDINRATSIFFSDGSMESAMDKAQAIESSRKSSGAPSHLSSSSSGHRLSSAAAPANRVPSPAALRLSILLPDATTIQGEFKESQSLWDIYFYVQESTYLRTTSAPFHFVRNTPYQVFGEDKFSQTLKEANINNGSSIRVQMGQARP